NLFGRSAKANGPKLTAKVDLESRTKLSKLAKLAKYNVNQMAKYLIHFILDSLEQ
ncbi:3845_t:CDS:1, partial [Rhizophagus irregularis]